MSYHIYAQQRANCNSVVSFHHIHVCNIAFRLLHIFFFVRSYCRNIEMAFNKNTHAAMHVSNQFVEREKVLCVLLMVALRILNAL